MNFIKRKISSDISEAVDNHFETNKKTYVVAGMALAVGYILGSRRAQPANNLIIKL